MSLSEVIAANGKLVSFANVGQSFSCGGKLFFEVLEFFGVVRVVVRAYRLACKVARPLKFFVMSSSTTRPMLRTRPF